jgi:hypothetical protein
MAPMNNPIIYQARNPSSAVRSYEIGPNHIWVGFSYGYAYKFSTIKVSSTAIETMKRKAMNGEGLGTFVTQNFPKGTHFYDERVKL